MGVIVQLEAGKRQPGGGSWEPKLGLPQEEEEVAEEEGSGWLAGSRRCSARSGNLWQPPRETSLVKGEYRKDVGLPCSGCSRPPRSPPKRQGPLCSPWGGCVSSGQGACSEAVPFGAAFIHRLLSGENCPHGRPTPSRRAGSSSAGMGGPFAVTFDLLAVCQDTSSVTPSTNPTPRPTRSQQLQPRGTR